MNDQLLKPCPFCGGTKLTFRPGFMSREVTHIILCLDCDISAGEYHTLPELIEAWNNRPDPWTTITADPATLPPVGSLGVLAAIHVTGNDTDDYREFDTAEKAYYDHDAKLWIDMMGDPIEHDYEGRSAIVYKWQPWPTPPPYPSAESQEQQ